MMKRTIETVCNIAEQAIRDGVTNRKKLCAAVPIVTELQAIILQRRKTLAEDAKICAKLSELCSKYALDNPSCFDELPLMTSANGVLSGEMLIDGLKFRLASGYDKPKRIDGDDMSQDFLSALPKDWTKEKLELDVTGINRKNVSTEELEAQGLFRPVKNTWTEV